MTKKFVLLISILYVVFFVVILFASISCDNNWCNVHDDDPVGLFLLSFAPLIPMFILSLVTYKMRDEAFQAWWGFAKWFAPIIVLVTYLQNIGTHTGGNMGLGDMGFSVFVLSILYIILIVVSLLRIKSVYKAEINNFLESISYYTARKYVLIVSGLSSAIFIYAALVLKEYFGNYSIDYADVYSAAIYLFFPMPVIFIISLLTYNFDIKVFRAWWGFAKWFVLLIVFISLILDSHPPRYEPSNVGDRINLYYLGASYAILFGVFAIKLWKVYKNKN